MPQGAGFFVAQVLGACGRAFRSVYRAFCAAEDLTLGPSPASGEGKVTQVGRRAFVEILLQPASSPMVERVVQSLSR